ncbi:aldo/keto reductase [Glaciibacter superstes]|uniref:aldo/keto reductase n=1 Tax=Glaciibacter superstes TaxID=501023 RepID=UPI00041EA94B|nr:aldo/keto reductase [Glaciibacter superstes]
MTAITAHNLTGVPVPMSALTLGTMTFGDTVDKREAAAMLDSAVAAGITSIDTANAYAGGATETMLGKLLADQWGELVLASKAGMPHPDAGNSSPLSAAGLRSCVEGSLRRLAVPAIDILYLHAPDRSAELSETLTTVAELVAEGKVRALGVSNYSAWQIGDVIRVAEQVGAPRPQLAQQLYNAVARRIEDEYLEFARTHRILTVVYNPLAGGLLTGRHSFEEQPSSGRYGDSRVAGMYRDRYWDGNVFAALDTLQDIAQLENVSLVELSLRWILSRSDVAGILLGGSRSAQLDTNIQALANGPLDTDVVDRIDAVGDALRGSMPAYNR